MNIIKLLKRHDRPRRRAADSSDRFEITLSGSGGQGMILAGKILAEAASIFDKKEAVMTQSYGPEARGGASRAEVIIRSEQIDYPKVMNVSILLAMTQEAMDKYGKLLSPDGLLIVDETFIKDVPKQFKRVLSIPFTSMALKMLENPIVANVIALGALAAVTGAVSRKALISAVLHRVPDKVIVKDRLAVDVGYKAVKDRGFKWRRA